MGIRHRPDIDKVQRKEAGEGNAPLRCDAGMHGIVLTLRSLADAIERGEQEDGDVKIEFVAAADFYGRDRPGAAFGCKVTVFLPQASMSMEHREPGILKAGVAGVEPDRWRPMSNRPSAGTRKSAATLKPLF